MNEHIKAVLIKEKERLNRNIEVKKKEIAAVGHTMNVLKIELTHHNWQLLDAQKKLIAIENELINNK